jgi:hypothetical protein
VSFDCANYYDITARLSNTRWRRVVPTETPGCWGGDCIVVPAMQAVAANPCLGVKLGTSGDAVAMDFAKIESGYAATTPIETTTASVVRQPDWWRRDIGTDSYSPNSLSMAATVIGTMGNILSHALYISATESGSTSTQAAYIYAGSSSTRGTMACAYGGTSIGFLTTLAGHNLGTRTACDFTPTTITGTTGGTAYNYTGVGAPTGVVAGVRWLTLGGRPDLVNSTNIDGVLRDVCFGSEGNCSVGSVGAAASDYAWVGDSLIAGVNSGPFQAPAVLESMRDGGRVWNAGAGSSTNIFINNTIPLCSTSYAGYASAGGVIWGCGTNDLSSATAAATATAAQATLVPALAAGKSVVVTGILPRGASAGWNSTLETRRTDYNALMSAWAADAGAMYVSTESMGEAITDGGCCVSLKAAYNSGDGLHLTKAGGIELANLVFDAGLP